MLWNKNMLWTPFALLLIILTPSFAMEWSKISIDSFEQSDAEKSEWIHITASGVPFWICLNSVRRQPRPSSRKILLFVEPKDFTQERIRTAFLWLSAQFHEPEILSVLARSDKEQLQKLVSIYRRFNSIDPKDRASRRRAEAELEGVSVSIQGGGYRADYIRLNANERFYYYRPNDANGVTVVLKSGASKFERTDNTVSDMVRAARLGLRNYVEMFLDEGADVNARDQEGYTALFAAALWRQREVVVLLLDRGAQVDMTGPNGWTPLLSALSTSRLDDTGVAEELLGRGANVNIRGYDGEIALTLATKKGQKGIVQELLRIGADVNSKDGSSKTALMIALENGLTEIALLLRRAGAVR